MKLVSARYASSRERQQAFSSQEAMTWIRQQSGLGPLIESPGQPGRFLRLNLGGEALQQVESGEWLLLKPEVYCFDWGQFEPSMREQRAMALIHSPPPQPEKAVRVVRVVDSETAEWLVNRRCVTTVEGEQGRRRTDGLGITHLSEPGKGANIELRLFAN